MTIRKPLLILAAMLMALPLSAQDDINDIVYSIIDHNAELAAQRKQIQAQKAEDSDANSLANPEVSFARVWGRHGIGNKLQLDVSQSFDWPGVYRLRSQASDRGISAAEMQVLSAELEMALQAKQQLIELVFVRRQLELSLALKSHIARLTDVVDKSAKAQEITIIDLRKLQFESYKLQCQITSLQSQALNIENTLQQMCPGYDIDFSIVDAYPAEPILDAAQYHEQISMLDPLLAAHRYAADQEALNARVARQQRLPGFSVGYQHQAEIGDRFNGFTVSMTLPFFQGRKAKAAAIARQEAAELAGEALQNQRNAVVDAQLAQLALWQAEIDNYSKAIGNSDYMSLVYKAYMGGEMSVIEYITEMQYYQECTATHLECEYNYQLTLSDLNRYSLLSLRSSTESRE